MGAQASPKIKDSKEVALQLKMTKMMRIFRSCCALQCPTGFPIKKDALASTSLCLDKSPMVIHCGSTRRQTVGFTMELMTCGTLVILMNTVLTSPSAKGTSDHQKRTRAKCHTRWRPVAGNVSTPRPTLGMLTLPLSLQRRVDEPPNFCLYGHQPLGGLVAIY